MELNTFVTDYESHRDDIVAIRYDVFVIEQQVSEELEIDGLDPEAIHALSQSGDKSIGTGRMLADGHIGRVAVLKANRGCGVGTSILLTLIKSAKDQGLPKVWLSSQTHAVPFYKKLGFTPFGDVYLEAGIDHIKTVKWL